MGCSDKEGKKTLQQSFIQYLSLMDIAPLQCVMPNKDIWKRMTYFHIYEHGAQATVEYIFILK